MLNQALGTTRITITATGNRSRHTRKFSHMFEHSFRSPISAVASVVEIACVLVAIACLLNYRKVHFSGVNPSEQLERSQDLMPKAVWRKIIACN